jgi:hypothetical protein
LFLANAGVPIHSTETIMYRTVILTSLMIAMSASVASAQSFVLNGWAEIPSSYRHPGPISGQFTTAANGVTPPYEGQPIPGFSGIIPGNSPGSFFGLPDNGYGGQDNSADFVIGFYSFTPNFKTTGDGTIVPGTVTVNSFTPFSDPKGLLNDSYITGGPVYGRTTYYPTPTKLIPVDPAIIGNKLLTGADFDVESFVRLEDGSFWVGEEFGPYLLHFNALGQLLDAPIAHPTLRAPQNPQNTATNPSNLPGSQGFESMARNADGTKLYLTTEASIKSEVDKRRLEIYEFDTVTKQYTGKLFKYEKDSSDFITGDSNNASNIFFTGDMTHVEDDRYIVIERDHFQGPPDSEKPPRQKKLYLIDLSEIDANSVLKKNLLVDLLDIPDPLNIGGPLPGIPDDKFSFPLQSVEAITMIDARTLLVGLDNNYPGGNGRIPGRPDNSELITIRFDKPLSGDSVPTPSTLFGLIAMGVKVVLRRREMG